MFALVSMWNRGRETSPNGDLSDDLGSDYFTSNTFSFGEDSFAVRNL